MATPARPTHFRRRLATAALVGWVGGGMAACHSLDPPPQAGRSQGLRGTVVLAMGIPRDATNDTELTEALKERLGVSLREFRLMHPQAQVQLQLFPEEHLLQGLRLRTAAGTGPDILFINNSTANDLYRVGLTRAVRLPSVLLGRMDPTEVSRFQTPSGELSSVPVLLLPQLACFDRRRLPQPPEDISELLRLSSQGLRVGLPLDGFNLAWTFGSLGAVQSVEDLFAGQPATPQRRAALGRWLVWLREADQLPNVTFQISQSQLIQSLGKGQLDWTSCRSTHLARLRTELGSHLGVAPLPRGPGGPPSPLSRQRVLAFGRNSNPAQKEVAEAFARFVVTPLTQRNLALQREEVLPVLGSMRLPEGRKGTLRLLAIAQAQVRRERGTGSVMFQDGDQEGAAMALVLSRYLYGDLDAEGTIDALVSMIQSREAGP